MFGCEFGQIELGCLPECGVKKEKSRQIWLIVVRGASLLCGSLIILIISDVKELTETDSYYRCHGVQAADYSV